MRLIVYCFVNYFWITTRGNLYLLPYVIQKLRRAINRYIEWEKFPPLSLCADQSYSRLGNVWKVHVDKFIPNVSDTVCSLTLCSDCHRIYWSSHTLRNKEGSVDCYFFLEFLLLATSLPSPRRTTRSAQIIQGGGKGRLRTGTNTTFIISPFKPSF